MLLLAILVVSSSGKLYAQLSFISGPNQGFTACAGSDNDITANLNVLDLGAGSMINWSIFSAPSHGVVTGLPNSYVSTGGLLSPSTTVVYTPTTGYSGTDDFTVIVDNGFSFDTTHFTVTVMSTPIVPVIMGDTFVCATSTLALTNDSTGGVWSSSDPAIANISSSGVVTGVDAGVVQITYSLTNMCGTGEAYHQVRVFNEIATISGATSLCVSTSTTLSSDFFSGSWTSSNTSVATVNATTGEVFGVSAGVATISYNACGAPALHEITVLGSPTAGTVVGSDTVCTSTPVTYTVTGDAGGTWSIDNDLIATIEPTTGMVTGFHAGTATITYLVSNTCGAEAALNTISIFESPTVTISAPTAICEGASADVVFNGTPDAEVKYTIDGGTTVTSNLDAVGFLTVNTGALSAATTYALVGITSSGCTTGLSDNVTITPVALPTASISGSTSICSGGTTSISFTGTPDANVRYVANSTDTLSILLDGSGSASYATPALTATTAYELVDVAVTGCTQSASGAVAVAVLSAPTATIAGANICSGNSATLTLSGTANATVTYHADAGTDNTVVLDALGNGIITTPALTVNSTYYITNVDNGACSTLLNDSAVVNVTTITASITGGAAICPGTIASVSVSGTPASTVTYQINGGADNTVEVEADGTTDFSIGSLSAATSVTISSVTDGTCVATLSDATNFSMLLTATATISGDTTICNGLTAVLHFNGTPDATVFYTEGSVSASAILNTLGSADVNTAPLAFSTTVTLDSIRSIDGCSTTGTGSVSVTVHPPLAASINASSTSVCSGSSTNININATTGDTVYYNIDGGATLSTVIGASGTNSISTGVITAATTYNLVSIANGQCSSTLSGSATVSIFSLTATANAVSTTICSGNSTTLNFTGSPNATVVYYINGGEDNLISLDASGNASLNTGVLTDTTTYTLYQVYSPGCTTSISHNVVINVNSAPVVNAISGASSVCRSSTTTLSNTTPLGSWTSNNLSVANVNATGIVTGVSVGSALISYTVIGACGTTSVTKSMNVTDVPAAPTGITGPSTVCGGTTITLNNVVAGGTWTSGNNAIATVDASSGIVTGVSTGTVSISYQVSNACGISAPATIPVEVNPPLPAIAGPIEVCIGNTITLSNTSGGGVWSSTNTTVANVNSSTGVVSGVSAGTAIISYDITGAGCVGTATTTITVSGLPVVSAISGPSNVCEGSTISLTNTTSGGVWTSSDATVAAVDAASGLLSGLVAGTTSVRYTVTTSAGCVNFAAKTITVKLTPVVDVISGPTSVCQGTTITLSNTTSGGTWSGTSAIASIGTTTGVVTGLTVGTNTFTYSVTNAGGCTTRVTYVDTVKAIPSLFAISGASSVCQNATTTYTNATTGGVWSSANSSIASVDGASGVITGIAGGTTSISYTVTSVEGCSNSTSKNITVNPLPSVGEITGILTICEGNFSLLGATVAGGTWNIDNAAIATIDATGTITALSAGTATVSYTVTNGCGAIVVDTLFTVNPLPVSGVVSGLSPVCAGGNVTYTTTGTGGAWASGNTAVATIDAVTGELTTIAEGNTVVSYTVTNGCGSATDTQLLVVNGPVTVDPISGARSVCLASTITLSSTTTSGTWTSSNTAVANINASGVVTPTAVGTVILTYQVANGACSDADTFLLSVEPIATPTGISGATILCVGDFSSLFNGVSGGVWSSSDIAIVIADAATGDIIGVSAGVATVSYSITHPTSGCVTSTTIPVTVNALPNVSAIAGAGVVCAGSTITLTDTTSGGFWNSTDIAVATVDASGVVTGVDAGVATISYTVINAGGCINGVAKEVTVNPLPLLTPYVGANTMCEGSTVTYTEATTGGVWSSANPAIASVNTDGVVSGNSAGGTRIIYSLTDANGCTNTVSDTVIVSAPPVLDTIAGPAVVCVASVNNYTNTTSSGTWSSSNTTVATIDALGQLHAVSAGSTTVSYAVASAAGCFGYATKVVTVETAPTMGAISGTTTVCQSGTTTLSETISGGNWGSSNANVSVDAAGIVSGLSVGTSIVSYSVVNSCGVFADTATVTVVAPLTAGTISGLSTICAGSPAPYTSTSGIGGVWSVADATIATVGATTGVVTGNTYGTTTITYTTTNACGSVSETFAINVDSAITHKTIAGITAICQTGTTTLSDASPAGTWSTSDLTASVDASGVVTGISAGTALVSYSSSNVCGTVVDTVTITLELPLAPAAIGGTSIVCEAATTTLTGATMGGTWSASGVNASVDAMGVVTGVTAGTELVSYTTTNTCGSNVDTLSVTVNPLPVAGLISGTLSVCEGGSTTTLSETVAGGVWSTSATTASIDATGVVTGINAGTALISYTITNSCGVIVDTTTVTINAFPTAGAISGTLAVCEGGATTTLSETVSGGVWSASNGNVSIDASGIVTGIADGSSLISYTITNGCGTVVDTATVTVNPLPAAGVVIGDASVCVGSSTAPYTHSLGGGTWSISGTAATFDAFNVLTGVTEGSVTLYYTTTNACGATVDSLVVPVNPLPASGVISGSSVVCIAGTVTLSETVTGGAWTTSGANAAVDIDGVVTGLSIGSATISYTTFTVCGINVDTFVINVSTAPVAGTISGINTICAASSTTLTETATGGTWSVSDAAIATVDAAGVVLGMSAGSVTVSYTQATPCGTVTDTFTMTINPLPANGDISGISAICDGGSTTLTETVTGGTWTVAGTGVIAVDAMGVVSTIGVGSDYVLYTVTNGCGTNVDSFAMVVNPLPTVDAITGTSSLCVGTTVTLSSTTIGGTWSSSNAGVAAIAADGTLAGIAAGTATVTYTYTNASGCSSFTTYAITVVNALPTAALMPGATAVICNSNPVNLYVLSAAGLSYQWYNGTTAISGATDSSYVATVSGNYSVLMSNGVCSNLLSSVSVTASVLPVISLTGGNVLFTGSFLGYQWYLNGVLIPGATSSTYTYTSGGVYTVRVTDATGCESESAGFAVTNVNDVVSSVDIKLYPNPASDLINIDAPFKVNVAVLGADGKTVISANAVNEISVRNLAAGMYMIMIYNENNTLLKADKFIKVD